MNYAALLIGPQGIGKSRLSAELAAALGATTLIDPWEAGALPAGALAITNDDTAAQRVPEGTAIYRVGSGEEMRQLLGTLTGAYAMNAPHPIATAAAADLFVAVPETTLPNGRVVAAFQVGQYVCTKNADGRAAVTAEGAPWVNINFAEAKAACEAAGYQLITETQWLAIAHNVAGQDCNWTKGKVGEGKLFRGLRKWTVNCAQPGTYEPTDPKERRWLTLSNGERVCDLNGNVFQWVCDDIQGDEQGLTTVIKRDSPSLQAPYPSETKGMGWRPDYECDWSGGALVRGGCWGSEASAGAFLLDYGWPDGRVGGVGFRCTKPIGL